MRRFYINLAIGVAISAIAGMATPVYAQSGHFVAIQQGIKSDQSATYNGITIPPWDVYYPSGIYASTSGAFISISTTYHAGDDVILAIIGYPTAAYGSEVTECDYEAPVPPGGLSAANFTQLNYFASLNGVSDCVMQPTLFYKVHFLPRINGGQTVSFLGSNSPSFVPTIASSTANPFFPQFAVVTGGFQITPTVNDSGLFLSGAQAFCNSVMGTSTAGIFGIGTDIANGFCQAAGYLFIPSTSALQNMANLEPILLTHIPFSYVLGVQTTWNSLAASSSSNVPQYTINLGSLGIGSTTALGNILPNQMDLLSSSTINKYLPSGIHDALYGLASIAIAMVAMYGMYREGIKLLRT